MPHFKTYNAFNEFSMHVRGRSRYILDVSTKEFLDTVLYTSEKRKRQAAKGMNLWRAQEGHGWRMTQQHEETFEIPSPHKPERMKPCREFAVEGRANAKGILCLYLATDKETAMAEVRPPVGAYVSVGQFKLLGDLSLIDCSVGHASGINLYFEEPDAEECEKAVWNDIDRAFSEPVVSGDSSVEYVPTQVLAELFKNAGFDGVVYKSNLGKGFNVTLFDIEQAELINCLLFKVRSVDYEFSEAGEPYFIKKYYERDSNS